MKFGFAQILDRSVKTQFEAVTILDDYLKEQFASREYGSGVTNFVIGLNCISPLEEVRSDFKTGTIIDKKYFKLKKILEVEIKLNHKKVLESNKESMSDIIIEGVLSTSEAVSDLAIKDFDAGRFYTDLKSFFDTRDWLINPERYRKEFHWIPEEKIDNQISSDEKLDERIFWHIVETSNAESKGDLSEQINLIVEKLFKMDEKAILGFELTLRELIKKSYHYNVMAVAKIAEGYLSDDSFLYFRCKLILYGSKIFFQAIEEPNEILFRIDSSTSGEGLLSAADRAFEKKVGLHTVKELPRDYACSFIDYNNDSYELLGKEWQEDELPKRYRKFWKKYNK